SLEAHGLHWDGPVQRQSEKIPAYEAALERLSDDRRLFYCNCSRKALRDLQVYPGTCRAYTRPRADCAIRVRVDEAEIAFTDLIVGPQRERLAESLGDFIIRRRDGLIAYQLATAVDDGDPSITRVIRGGDLLDNTARQIFLMEALKLSVPQYGHLATLVYPDGAKLSKQSHAPALDDGRATANLTDTLQRLGMNPPDSLTGAKPAELLGWAQENFRLEAVSAADVIYRH
ncbi:MAG: glutamate--tRNA ligase family protein, partial [Pseudomonadota bacterium]